MWISTKYWTSNRPSRKLGYQNEGLFEVIEKVGHSFWLDIPGEETRQNVYPAEVLCKDPANPLDSQCQEPLALVIYGQEPEWEVEKVLYSRQFKKKL